MAWKVLKLSSYSTVGTITDLVDDVDGFLIRVGFRDYRTGEIYQDTKFTSYMANLSPYASHTKIGYYFETQAITNDEVDEEVAFVNEMIAEYYINDFPLYMQIEQGNTTGTGRADNLTQEQRTMLFQHYVDLVERPALLIHYEYSNHINMVLASELASVTVVRYDLFPSYDEFTVDAWEYDNNDDTIPILRSTPPILYYTDEAGWMNGAPISNFINRLKQTSFPYTGSQIKPEVMNPYELIEGTDYTLTYKYNINVPNETLGNPYMPQAIVKGIHNFTGSITLHFRITAIPLPVAITLTPSAVEYTGKNIKPNVAVQGLRTDDYTVTYNDEDLISIGQKSVTVHGRRNYYGDATGYYNVTPAKITADKFSIEKSYVYTGDIIQPIPVEKDTRLPGNYDVEYELGEYDMDDDASGEIDYDFNNEALEAELDFDELADIGQNNKDVGIANGVVRIIGKNNFAGQAVLFFDITRDITVDDFEISSDIYEYTGEPVTPKVSSPTELVEGENFTVAYEDNIDVGEAKIILTAIYPYTGQAELTFTIDRIDISAYIWRLDTYTYGFTGEPIEPEVIVENTFDDGVYNFGDEDTQEPSYGDTDYDFNEDDKWSLDFNVLATKFDPDAEDKREWKPTYDVVYDNNVNTGVAHITITGNGDYKGTVTIDFNIVMGDVSTDCEFQCEVDEYGIYDLSTLKVYDFVRNRYLTEGVDYYFDNESQYWWFPYNPSYIRMYKEITGYYNYTGKLSKVFPCRYRPDVDPVVPLIMGYPAEVIFNNGGKIPEDEVVPEPEPTPTPEPEPEPDPDPSGHPEEWIPTSDIFPGEPESRESDLYPAGYEIRLDRVQYYSSFENIYPEEELLSGTFYIFSGKSFNNRIQVTGINTYVNKPSRTIGWISVNDVLSSVDGMTFYVGDRVYVLDYIYRNQDGSSGYINKVGEYMYIVDIIYSLEFEFGDEDEGGVSDPSNTDYAFTVLSADNTDPEADFDQINTDETAEDDGNYDFNILAGEASPIKGYTIALSNTRNGKVIGWVNASMIVHDYDVVNETDDII